MAIGPGSAAIPAGLDTIALACAAIFAETGSGAGLADGNSLSGASGADDRAGEGSASIALRAKRIGAAVGNQGVFHPLDLIVSAGSRGLAQMFHGMEIGIRADDPTDSGAGLAWNGTETRAGFAFSGMGRVPGDRAPLANRQTAFPLQRNEYTLKGNASIATGQLFVIPGRETDQAIEFLSIARGAHHSGPMAEGAGFEYLAFPVQVFYGRTLDSFDRRTAGSSCGIGVFRRGGGLDISAAAAHRALDGVNGKSGKIFGFAFPEASYDILGKGVRRNGKNGERVAHGGQCDTWGAGLAGEDCGIAFGNGANVFGQIGVFIGCGRGVIRANGRLDVLGGAFDRQSGTAMGTEPGVFPDLPATGRTNADCAEGKLRCEEEKGEYQSPERTKRMDFATHGILLKRRGSKDKRRLSRAVPFSGSGAFPWKREVRGMASIRFRGG